MTVADLLKQVRYALNDTEGVEFSDSELINYLNQAKDYVVQSAVSKNFKGFVAYSELTLVDGKAKLPDDFLFESAVVSHDGRRLMSTPVGQNVDENTYKIEGSYIYAKRSPIGLYYYRNQPDFLSLSDEINLPPVFFNLLREIVQYLALNRTNVNAGFELQLTQLFERKVEDIVSRYGNGSLELKLPFKV